MARSEKGAAQAAPSSLFTWVDSGPNRRRLVSRRQVGTLRAPEQKPEKDAEPTVAELRDTAAELEISGRSSMTKAELQKAIEKKRAGE